MDMWYNIVERFGGDVNVEGECGFGSNERWCLFLVVVWVHDVNNAGDGRVAAVR